MLVGGFCCFFLWLLRVWVLSLVLGFDFGFVLLVDELAGGLGMLRYGWLVLHAWWVWIFFDFMF